MLHAFIINSFAGPGSKSAQIREELESKKDLDYVVFNSEYPGHEGELAAQIYELFPNEQIRFYACGGSGTLRNIMSGLPDFKRAQFAEYPCGTSNDFLAVFGKAREHFKSLDNLIHGNVVEFDYIQTNAGRALNTLSCGYDVRMVKAMSSMSKFPFGKYRPGYVVSSFMTMLSKSNLNYRIEADGRNIDATPDMILLANGRVFGGTFRISTDNSPMDGSLDLLIVPKKNFFFRVRFAIASLQGNVKFINAHGTLLSVKRLNLYPRDENGYVGNFDGELSTSTHLEAHVVPKGCRFVVPKQIDVEEVLHAR